MTNYNQFILQWNLNGYYNNLNELQILIKEYDPIIIALQESHLKNQHTINLRNYTAFRKDDYNGLNARGGVLTLVKNSFFSSPIPLVSHLQTIAVQVIVNNKRISVCNIYLNPAEAVNYNEIKSITDQLPPPYILLGDFNAHNTMWGSKRNNQRGNEIEQPYPKHKHKFAK